MADEPTVLFVCVKNGGKSQMAAGLMRHRAGDQVNVDSAGTLPGATLNDQSVSALLEVGIDIRAEVPKLVTPDLVWAADLVVLVGREAHVEPVDGTRFETWPTRHAPDGSTSRAACPPTTAATGKTRRPDRAAASSGQPVLLAHVF